MKRLIVLALLLTAVSFIFAVPRDMVIIEVGTGTWCPYCPGASMGTHQLLENGYNVAVIKNQNGDAFANIYSNARNSYYGISNFPTAIFDGTLEYVGGSNTQSLYNIYLPLVNQRLAVPSAYTITAEGELENNIFTVDVTVTKVEDDTNTNVVLHSSVTESNIQFNWQGQTELDNVNRVMAPHQNGTPINLSTGESTTITLTFNLSNLWYIPNLELVLWLQNVNSKEILQGTKYSVPGLSGAFPASEQAIDFPDTYIGGFSSQNLDLYNFSNEEISATLSTGNFAFLVDPMTVTIPPSESATVEILFMPTSMGDFSSELTIVGNFPNHPTVTIPLSGYAFINIPPIAENVSVFGPPVYLQPIAGTYSFSDEDGDEEGSTIMSWHRWVDGNPIEIDNANQITYTIQQADIGYQISFGVTPKDIHGMPGELVLSEPTDVIINLPAPRNFNGELIPPNTVSLSWEPPQYFDGRTFLGYRIFRNGLLISTIVTPSVLSFNDINVPVGEYEYWICSLFSNPMMNSEPSPSIFIEIEGTATEDLVNPAQFSISAMPNPFLDQTILKTKSAPNEELNISIFNIKGQLIQNFKAHSDATGESFVTWDGLDNRGRVVNSGIYLYRIESPSYQKTKKLIKISH
nr:hypothetical protein [Candidatus Cloacimonadota bacterium]